MFGDLTTEFEDQRFSILLFPCNQFLSQEPSAPTPSTIKRMSTGSVDMDVSKNISLFNKVDVNGSKASPVFQFLRYNSSLYDEEKHISKPIPWNFGKFLVDSQGGVAKFLSPQANADTVKDEIRTLLGQGAPVTPTRRPTLILDENALPEQKNEK